MHEKPVKPIREPIPLSASEEESILAFWGCATEPRCRGLALKAEAYYEDGIEYIEATCLRCGKPTRYPRSEVD